MKKWILKELVLKLDFQTGECEIGWIWIIFYIIPKALFGLVYMMHDISKLLHFIFSS
jgi:hypothetical protein